MALNLSTLELLIDQMESLEVKTYGTQIRQLFHYFDETVPDNSVYKKYNSDYPDYKNWINKHVGPRGNWKIPDTIHESRVLAFSIYKDLSLCPDDLRIYTVTMFSMRSSEENLARFHSLFFPHLKSVIEEIVSANDEFEDLQPKLNIGDTVFIIHGHDDLLKTKLQLLLNRAGVNSVVLHEKPDLGRTIIDKLIQEGSKAGYAIALLTGDDVVEGGIARARQNVILEVGYFMGILGKERVRLLVSDGVEKPSDLQGILHEKYDKEGSWKSKILKELIASGIHVDMRAALESL